jgi:hypothetical protein
MPNHTYGISIILLNICISNTLTQESAIYHTLHLGTTDNTQLSIILNRLNILQTI